MKLYFLFFSFFCANLSYATSLSTSLDIPVTKWLYYEDTLTSQEKDFLYPSAYQGDICAQRKLISFEFNKLNKDIQSKELYDFLYYYHEQACWIEATSAFNFITLSAQLKKLQEDINNHENKINLLRETKETDEKLIKTALKLNLNLCKLKSVTEEIIIPNYDLEASKTFLKYINKKLYNYRLKNLNEDFFKKVNKHINEILDLIFKI